MDPVSISELVPVLAEPVGIGALGAMALWLGARVLSQLIGAGERVALARLAEREVLSQAMASQSTALSELTREQGELRRASQSQVITLRMIAGRLGMGWTEGGPRDDETGGDGDAR